MKGFAWIVVLLVIRGFVSMAQAQFSEKEDSLQNRNENFYEKNSSSKWIRELKNIIIVSPKKESISDSFNVQSPSNIYTNLEGRTITQIRIVRLKPFGTSVTDSVTQNVNLLGKAGNAIHVSTSEFIVRNVLLFSEGDKVNSLQLAYSERYLRSLKYINDARVTAIPISDDEVEVVVTVQDILPYSVNFGTNFESRANFGLVNHNIIGLGIEMRAGAFMDSQKDHLMGYEATLRLPNIGRTFISLQADYLDRYENQRYGFRLQRDFYAPTIRYAGHLIFFQAQTPVRYIDPNGELPTNHTIIKYNHLNMWIGRSFRIDNNSLYKQYKNITISLGAQQMYFIDRPEHSEEHYYRFQNRTTYLASLTYTQQSFYKANLIYNFGKTEDIPYGYKLSIVGGKEVNEMYNQDRPYFGTLVSSGHFIPSFGYLSSELSFGTFFRNGTDQGTIDIHLNYFTNLYVMGNFRQRTYINSHYTRQLYNQLGDQLVIDGELGIPGFRNDSVLGRQRLNLSMEHDLFTPWNLYQFRFVIYVFGNLSWLGGYDKSVILSPLYSSFGFGFRIRNNRLIFNTLQIRFAYFPNIPANSKFRYFYLSRETVLQPREFIPNAPEVMPLY